MNITDLVVKILKANKLMEFTVNNGCNHHDCGHH